MSSLATSQERLIMMNIEMATFRALKNNEMRQFGEYRTQRLVLEAWDRLCQH